MIDSRSDAAETHATARAAGTATWEDPGLTGAKDWVFDLDNTLYPAACNLFHQVDLRMSGFISERLGISHEDARALQKRYFREHGTTLRGLMAHHDVDPRAFLGFIHDIDYSLVPANADLGAALAALPGRKLILTNSTMAHTEAVLDRLGIAAAFGGIFDIVAADFVPKPQPEPYHRMIQVHDIDPACAVMVEDISRNLKVPAALGMRTVWVKTGHAWSGNGASADFVHHETEDLTAWLTELARRL